MTPNRYIFVVFFSFFMATLASAQVDKTIIVEHFTNTRCGICAFKNPTFFSNLNSQDGILHIAYHPSSPYSNCLFSQHNPSENDGRTNFYGIFGSTPKFTIQGVNIPANVNMGSADIWTPYVDQTSELSVAIEQTKDAGNINATVTINTEIMNSLGDVLLFVGVAEDTIFYDAPNGEDQHYNVFREAMTSVEGNTISIAATAGSTIQEQFTLPMNADWEASRMFTYVIIQDATTKEVIQSAAASAADGNVITSNKTINTLENVSVFPNPTSDFVQITVAETTPSTAILYDVLGKNVREVVFSTQTQMNMADLPQGSFFLEIINEKGRAVQKIMKE